LEQQYSEGFAFVWSIDTHAPYAPPDDFDKFWVGDNRDAVSGERDSIRGATKEDVPRLLSLYDGEIAYNDYYIGQLIKDLKRLDIYNDTLIIVTGDHGEGFNEHGLFSHGNIPYEELIHVPLIMKFPNDEFAGQEITALTDLTDVFPTLLDYLGLLHQYQGGSQSLQGYSLLSVLRGEKTEVRDYVYSETRSLNFQNIYLSIRDHKWKYIESHPPKRSLRTLGELIQYVIKQDLLATILRHPLWFLRRHAPRQRDMLFDLRVDTKELRNLASSNANTVITLRDELSAWQKGSQLIAQNVETASYDPNVDETIRDRLEELGYL
jgi:arylsulfatase A-like enzyme